MTAIVNKSGTDGNGKMKSVQQDAYFYVHFTYAVSVV